MKNQAQVVVIGGGITGCSIAYHLAEMGWTDVVLLDKGELTSGTTFHSVGLVSQFRTSPAQMLLMNYSIQLYNQFKAEVGKTLGWHQVGSLRLASSPDQLKALQRNVSQTKALGLDAGIISPAEALRIFPPMTDKSLYGAVYIPDDGYLAPNGITYEFARRAKKMGVQIHTGVRVTGIDLSPKGEVSQVNTTYGSIKTQIIVNAAGEWAPRIGEMVGATIPMTAIMHQFLTTKPIPGYELPLETPVVRDPDNLVYIREEVRGFLVGGFELNPKAWEVDGVPWEFTQSLLAPEWDLFDSLMEGAMRRVPILEKSEVIGLINGPDAVTPDGQYCLGPLPDIRGFYVAAGMSLNGIAGAGGVGKIMAEWIIDGYPSIDVHEMNVRRFGSYYSDLRYTAERAREVYKHYYYLHYPNDEGEWGRPKRLGALYPRLQELGAVFGVKNGWERANYFELDKSWRSAGAEQRKWGWGHPPHFDLIGEEHKAVRERVGLLDMTSFGKIEVRGSGALDLLQRLACNNIDKPVGSLTYTQFLNERGGIESDLTIARLGKEHFRVVTGTSFATSDFGWIRLHMPEDGSVEIKDVSNDWVVLSMWGPRARDVLQTVTENNVSNEAFPYMTAQAIKIGDVDVWAQRVSYAGELGWEMYIAPEQAVSAWDTLMEAGQEFGIQPVGYKALDSLRLEKGYRYWSADITPSENSYEAGMGFVVRMKSGGDFIGRQALLKVKEEGIQRRLCTLTLDDKSCVIYGGEAVYCKDKLVGRVTSGGFGYTVGKNIAISYLPLDLAVQGTSVEIEIFGEYFQADVAEDALYDPTSARLRG